MEPMTGKDSVGQVVFEGTQAAQLFTRELAESLAGVLAHNYVSDPRDPMVGFVSASIDGRPWTDTMWTRDAGVFLRELVQWGDLEPACQITRRLIDMVRENDEGYFTFPMYFPRGKPGSGSELDGTAAIVIALVLLWERLAEGHAVREEMDTFLDSGRSPLAYMLKRLEQSPLIPGSGEFGGGCGIEGEFYNVVQNNLVRLALLAASRRARAQEKIDRAERYERAAGQIGSKLLHYLCDVDGSWLWTLSVDTLQPDPRILEHPINKGFGGLNGILAMEADVGGFTPLESAHKEILDASLNTFERLYKTPKRQAMFEKYGIWTQFDNLMGGYYTSPSYGHCYATQVMLLMDRTNMAGKAVDFLAQMTYEPFPGNYLDRESPYHFYERCYLPELLELMAQQSAISNRQEIPDWIKDSFDGENFDQGCGALNLVNVAEPMKIARLIIGVDDSDIKCLRLIPRLPPGWHGYHASNWPILTSDGVVRVDIHCTFGEEEYEVKIRTRDGMVLPSVAVRLPGADGFVWQCEENLREGCFRHTKG